MSDHIDLTSTAPAAEHSRRGQSLVEFALVLPMLIVLFLGIADFGRVFHAGIVTEAAARDAAEVAAQEFLQVLRRGGTVDYPALHRAAAKVACEETKDLPSTTFAPDGSGFGGTCPSMPVIRVCIHDDVDPECGDPITDFASTIPDPQCSRLLDPAWTPAREGVPDGEESDYVEVRICYRFTTLFNLDLSLPLGWGLSLGDIWLQERSVFTVHDY